MLWKCDANWYENMILKLAHPVQIVADVLKWNCHDIYSSFIAFRPEVLWTRSVRSDHFIFKSRIFSFPFGSRRDRFTSLDRIHWASHNICHPAVSSFTRFCVRFIVNNTERLEVIHPWEKQKNVLSTWPIFYVLFRSLYSMTLRLGMKYPMTIISQFKDQIFIMPQFYSQSFSY